MRWKPLVALGVAALIAPLMGATPAPAMVDARPVVAAASAAGTPCENGFADQYPCMGVDLLSRMSHAATGGGAGNDIWGWTDPQTGREYALVGKTVGTAFVDITVPDDPVYLGLLPTTPGSTGALATWRDIKVYADHAYVVSEEPFHGVQVFDLTRLRGVSSAQEWTVDAHYPLVGAAHNIAINEETGYAYAVGSGVVLGAGGCSGLHMIDVREPKNPLPAGCFQLDGYTHDAQCVTYRGPDQRYTGNEICLNSNEDTLTVADVTDKLSPQQLSRTGYPGADYTHQGWLTEDQRYFLLGDEGDETAAGVNTTTYIFDVADLTDPQLIGVHRGRTQAIDHNLYVRDDLVYQANYRAGLQILSLEDVAAGELREVAYFDVHPSGDAATFNGAWSNYPYFESGVVIVNSIERGLFVVRPRLADLYVEISDAPDPVAAGEALTYTFAVTNDGPADATGVAMSGTLPGGVSLADESTLPVGCALEAVTLTCDVGGLAAGAQTLITIEVTANQAGEHTTVAEVSANEADPHVENNTAEAVTTAG